MLIFSTISWLLISVGEIADPFDMHLVGNCIIFLVFRETLTIACTSPEKCELGGPVK